MCTFYVPYSGKFLWDPNFVDGQSSKFSWFNFTDACNHAHYTLYNHAYFHG
jgi:hypothetical protein